MAPASSLRLTTVRRGSGEPIRASSSPSLKGHTSWVRSAAFSEEGSRVVTASRDKTARIWRSDTGVLVAELKGHTDGVRTAVFSVDGTLVVTASDDKTARIWRADTGVPVAELKGHTGEVKTAAFSEEGSRVVTASQDQTARIWSFEAVSGDPVGDSTLGRGAHRNRIQGWCSSSVVPGGVESTKGRTSVQGKRCSTRRLVHASDRQSDHPLTPHSEHTSMPTLANAHALIVGIADYANIRKLPKVRDAEDLAAALVDPELCGYDPKKVTVLLDQDATQVRIRAGLDALKQGCDANSTVFLYFSGHGGQIKEGTNKGQYLLPVEVVYPGDDDLARTAISGQEFTEALRAIPAKRLTVVLDCCHAGGIGEPRDLGETEPIANGLSDGYLNGLKEGTGRVIISATRGTDPAYVRDGAKYGVFTGHFLEGLRGAARRRWRDPHTRPLFLCATESGRRPAEPAAGAQGRAGGELPDRPLPWRQAPAPEPIERLDDGFKYDVFLSYRQQEPDKTWVRKTLLPKLKAEGLKVFIDYVDFELGEPIVTEMERAVVQSRYTIGVLSPNYLTSNFTDLESMLSEHLGLEKARARFIGVCASPVQPRLGIRARYYLDMTDDDEFDTAIARLVAQARKSPNVEKLVVASP